MHSIGRGLLLAASLIGPCLHVAVVAAQEAISFEGTIDCGMWVDSREKDKAQVFEAFALGTLNGLSFGSWTEFWQAPDGNRISRESAFLWLDNYCRENPLAPLNTGVVALFRERTGG